MTGFDDAEGRAELSDATRHAAARLVARVVSERTAQLEAAIPGLVEVLGEAQIDSILLKGPVTRQRLYADDEVRATADIDLLVPPRWHRRARKVLVAQGFEVVGVGGHSDTMRRGRTYVDLHLALPFVGLSPHRAFGALWAHTTTISVAGQAVTCLDEPAHVLHLALHAAQDRFRSDGRALDEWRRGIASLSDAQVASATRLAAHLRAGGVWASARGLLEPGADAAAAAASLPARKPALSARGVWAFLRADLPWRVRWRAGREFARRQVSDDVVAPWRARRGLPAVEPGTWAMRGAKLTRLTTAMVPGAGRLRRGEAGRGGRGRG